MSYSDDKFQDPVKVDYIDGKDDIEVVSSITTDLEAQDIDVKRLIRRM